MSELITLETSLRELLAKLDSITCPLILGGGYGLSLRRTILRRNGARTLADHGPHFIIHRSSTTSASRDLVPFSSRVVRPLI